MYQKRYIWLFFYLIGNFVPYQVKIVRGNTLRRNRIMRGVIMKKTDGGVRIGTYGGAAPAVSMTAGTVLLKITGRRLIIDEMEKTLEGNL